MSWFVFCWTLGFSNLCVRIIIMSSKRCSNYWIRWISFPISCWNIRFGILVHTFCVSSRSYCLLLIQNYNLRTLLKWQFPMLRFFFTFVVNFASLWFSLFPNFSLISLWLLWLSVNWPWRWSKWLFKPLLLFLLVTFRLLIFVFCMILISNIFLVLNNFLILIGFEA